MTKLRLVLLATTALTAMQFASPSSHAPTAPLVVAEANEVGPDGKPKPKDAPKAAPSPPPAPPPPKPPGPPPPRPRPPTRPPPPPFSRRQPPRRRILPLRRQR